MTAIAIIMVIIGAVLFALGYVGQLVNDFKKR